MLEPPQPGTSNAWWRAYAGQRWYTGGGNDAGCRVGFEVRQRLDAEIWPVVRCIAAQANTAVNVPGAPSVGTLVTSNCQLPTAGAIGGIYGDGSDLVPLIDPPEGGEGGGLVVRPDPPRPFDPGLTSRDPIELDPELGFGG
jgi:hypothetical protein